MNPVEIVPGARSTAMDQAVRDAEKFHDGAPTVFHRRNREGWLVTMQLSDWLALFRASQISQKERNQ